MAIQCADVKTAIGKNRIGQTRFERFLAKDKKKYKLTLEVFEKLASFLLLLPLSSYQGSSINELDALLELLTNVGSIEMNENIFSLNDYLLLDARLFAKRSKHQEKEYARKYYQTNKKKISKQRKNISFKKIQRKRKQLKNTSATASGRSKVKHNVKSGKHIN